MPKIIQWSRTVLTLAATLAVATFAVAAPPMPPAADADYGASGYLTPRGMPPVGAPGVMPAMYSAMPGPPMGVMQAGGMGMPGGQGVSPAGFNGSSGCDTSGCDCLGYGCNRCSSGPVGSGGILDRMRGGGPGMMGPGMMGQGPMGHGMMGHGGGGRMGMLGNGRLRQGHIGGLLSMLMPYGEAGLNAPRWFDFSAEATFLKRNTQNPSSLLSSFGAGVPPTPALYSSAADLEDIEAGIRLSGAIILGVGSNLELTYMGGNKWEDSSAVNGPNNLFSFISVYGTNPPGGYADSDNASRQGISGEANFHSGEINYRQRTAGATGRLQGSWLAGLRYIRLDDALTFTSTGNVGGTPRFLNLTNSTKNDLFGVQVGGDLWWNLMPGVSIGSELKLGVLENDVNRNIYATGSNIGPGATAGSRGDFIGSSETTGMLELNTAIVYRLSHSWAFRSSYYILAVDEIGGGMNLTESRNLLLTPQVLNTNAGVSYDPLVLQGFTFGAEYTW